MTNYTFLRISDVSRLIGKAESGIYAMRDPLSDSYDPTWPAPVVLSPRCVRYRSDEVQAWMDAKSSQRDIGTKERKELAAKAGKAGAASRKAKASAADLAGQA